MTVLKKKYSPGSEVAAMDFLDYINLRNMELRRATIDEINIHQE